MLQAKGLVIDEAPAIVEELVIAGDETPEAETKTPAKKIKAKKE